MFVCSTRVTTRVTVFLPIRVVLALAIFVVGMGAITGRFFLGVLALTIVVAHRQRVFRRPGSLADGQPRARRQLRVAAGLRPVRVRRVCARAAARD